MRRELVQRVVEQRQEIEKQALLHVARLQGRLDDLDRKIALLNSNSAQLGVSINEMLVIELAEQRRRQQLQQLVLAQTRVVEELRQAQNQLRDARADRVAAGSLQDKQISFLKRQQRRRQQRQLDDMAGAAHLGLVRGT